MLSAALSRANSSKSANRLLGVLDRYSLKLAGPHYSAIQNRPSSTVLLNNTRKISSRSAQIVRHFSSSPREDPVVRDEANMASKYTVRKIGAPNTLEHRIYIEKDGVPVSPFHDIPLYANEQQTILNMVVEIPRWTNGKLEVRRLAQPFTYASTQKLPFENALTYHVFRSPKKSRSIPSSKTSRKASSASSETASLIRVTSGTTAPSLRYGASRSLGIYNKAYKPTDLGGPKCHPSRDQGKGRQRPIGCL